MVVIMLAWRLVVATKLAIDYIGLIRYVELLLIGLHLGRADLMTRSFDWGVPPS